MDITSIALKVDSNFNSLNSLMNPPKTGWSYGRGLEQASGMGLWFVAFTLVFSSQYGVTSETLQINNFFLAWIVVILGGCQLYYTGRIQRMVFTICSTIVWLTIALGAYSAVGDWNLLTAAALPYSLSTFYIFGFLCGPDSDKPER